MIPDVNVHSCHFLLDHIQLTLIHGPNIPGSYLVLFFTASDFTFTTRHIHTWASFPLWPSHFILSGAIIDCPLLFPSSILDILQSGGVHLLVSYPFAFLYYSKCSHSKNSGMVCHLLLQWTTFCQNSPLWPIHLEWPSTAWLITWLSYTSSFTMTKH